MQRKRRNEELLECAMSGRHREVARLLEEGADIATQDREGYTPISEAASAGHTVVVGQLLRSLADPNTPAFDGRTALHRAVFQNWIPTMRLLLDNGADPDAKDRDGAMPVDLVRTGGAKELLESVSREENRAKREELEKQRAALPARPEEDGEAAQEAPADEAQAAAPEKFEPPPRTEAPKETREERRQKAREARDAAKAERERRYQAALSEIAELTKAVGEDGQACPLPEAPPPLRARVEVRGAGERRLNGAYHAEFAAKDRVEFRKEGDSQCGIVWTEYHNEWRMSIGDFKMGNTLYRHRHRPNIRAEENLGCPLEGWQEWFGRGPCPTLRALTEEEEVEDAPSDEEDSPAASERVAREGAPGEAAGASKPSQFIELRSNLEIVKKDVGAAAVPLAGARRPAGGPEISITGGERLVETADGLFSPAEVAAAGGADAGVVAVEEVDAVGLAAAWMEDLAGAPEVPPVWGAIQAAKAAAQDLFAEGRLDDARQATTAAIRAASRLLQRLASPGLQEGEEDLPSGGDQVPPADEVENTLGVLHSNRSLLLLRQIEAGDQGALQHGAEVAWGLVAKDAGKALAIDRTNFKASFRRARALFETGDLEGALEDASRVVEHYARNSPTPNPEAAALREKIVEAIRQERQKWGQKAPARWNRASREEPAWQAQLVTELGATAHAAPTRSAKAADAQRASAPAPTGRGPPAPRRCADVEKALLVTLRGADERAAYFREHLSPEVIRKFFGRVPLGPDLLGAFVRVLADIAAEDVPLASKALDAVAAAPSAKTQAQMFDAEERACLQRLVDQVGPEAVEFWRPEVRDDAE